MIKNAFGSAVMEPRESIYLDLIRALAAIAVVFDHAPFLFRLPQVPHWGHQAVIVFFVLSGYIISHVADTRENTPRRFLVARFARLWSVLVPAMILTILCDWIGRTFGHYPRAYEFAPEDYPFIRVGAALAFLSESWVSIQPLSNGVIWSLCVEFWYYILFAAWTFVPAGRYRTATILVVCLLAGHKALLLSPIWLLGVALQRSRSLRRLSVGACVALWVSSFLLMCWILIDRVYDGAIHLMGSAVTSWVFIQLDQARVFWFDWLFGIVIAANLLSARAVATRLPLERISWPIRRCAGISFAAYLFHMPLLHLMAAFLPSDQGWLAIALTFSVIALLGPPIERSKRWWQRQIDNGLRRVMPVRSIA